MTATGSDEALAAIRQQVPVNKRFVGYGHRLSFAFVSSGVLQGFNAKKIVSRAADDVIAWNQLGCLSPHVIYVEHGGTVSAEQFAALLADELAGRNNSSLWGDLPVEIAAAIASRRSVYELRAAYSKKEPEAPPDRSLVQQRFHRVDGRLRKRSPFPNLLSLSLHLCEGGNRSSRRCAKRQPC